MPRPIIKPPKPKYHVEIDWKAYFSDFNAEHGGEPMMLEKERKLLYRDGWKYNAFNHAGPEYLPPDDRQKRLNLQEKYWTMRLRIVQAEIWQLDRLVNKLKMARQVRSLPIREKQVTINDGTGEKEYTSPLITDEPFMHRMSGLERDKGDCLAQLARIAKDRTINGTSQIAQSADT